MLKSGIKVINNSAPISVVDELRKQIESFLESKDNNFFKEDDFEYNDLVSRNETTIIKRIGLNGKIFDKGMIDIFHPEKKFPIISIENLKLTEINDHLIGLGYVFKNFNVYVNSGVTNTRPAHYDGEKQVKVFVYLTNVQKVCDGPYSYLPYSNKFNLLLKIIYMLRGKLTRNYNYAKDFSILHPFLKKYFGNKGTVIISDQEGIHRGTPQNKSGYRMVLVLNYL